LADSRLAPLRQRSHQRSWLSVSASSRSSKRCCRPYCTSGWPIRLCIGWN